MTYPASNAKESVSIPLGHILEMRIDPGMKCSIAVVLLNAHLPGREGSGEGGKGR